MNRLTVALLFAAAVGLTATATVAKEPNKADANKLICKSQVETGSLAKRKRECFTKEEWDKLGEAHRRGWSRVVDDLRTRPGGN